MIRSDQSTVRMPAVLPKAERDLADALRLLAAIHRIAKGTDTIDAASIALGRIAGLTAHTDILHAAADVAETYIAHLTGGYA